MPKMDGYEVCKRLKTNPDTKGIPILIFTVSGQRDLEQKCILAGANVVIMKPFEATELLESVNKLLKGQN